MKVLDYLYTNIYAQSYERTLSTRKGNPSTSASLVIGLDIGGWFLVGSIIYYHFVYHKFPGVGFKYLSILLALIVTGIINSYYSTNERNLNLYNHFKQNGKLMSKKNAIFLVLGLIFLPYLVSIIFSIYNSKH